MTLNHGVNAVVVGLGHWGPNLVRNLRNLGSLHGFSDQQPSAVEKMAASAPEAKIYPDLAAVLADDAVDAVLIATPAVTHGKFARAALEAGKHVFVEKPLCLDLEEAAALGTLADQKGLTLMVGHLLRYHGAFMALQDHVQAGNIGTLRYIYSNRLSLGKIRREENALWSFAPHDISMILALAASRPTRVVANGEAFLTPGVADTSLTHLTFENGAQAHIFVSWLHPYKEQRLIVVGSEGMIVFNDVAKGEDKLLHYSHKVRWSGDLPDVEKAAPKPVPYAATEPLAEEIGHFLECVRTGHRPRTDAREGYDVLNVLDASHRALKTGTPVTL